jgi:hypothetical protein
LTGNNPWTVPVPPSPTQSQVPKKTFGFGAAASGISPFSAVAQSSSGWSGWDNQKPAVFEKKSLFGPSTAVNAIAIAKPPLPPKMPATEEKKVDGSDDEEEDDDTPSADENDGESEEEDSGDLESTRFENGDESDKPNKVVDMRERNHPQSLDFELISGSEAGEGHEETLFETTCTLYETDPNSGTWVSKGTGIIHVNIDRDWAGKGPRASRLSISPSMP